MSSKILTSGIVTMLAPFAVLAWFLAYAIALGLATFLVPMTAFRILADCHGRVKARQARRAARESMDAELTPEQREQARRFGL